MGWWMVVNGGSEAVDDGKARFLRFGLWGLMVVAASKPFVRFKPLVFLRDCNTLFHQLGCWTRNGTGTDRKVSPSLSQSHSQSTVTFKVHPNIEPSIIPTSVISFDLQILHLPAYAPSVKTN